MGLSTRCPATPIVIAKDSPYTVSPVNKSAKRLSFFAAANGGLAVIAGAFATHSLRPRLTVYFLEIFQLAAQYQILHALALFAAAWMVSKNAPYAKTAGWLFVFGIAVFCGSLYALALTQFSSLGAITPIGGVSLIVGWGLLALGATRMS